MNKQDLVRTTVTFILLFTAGVVLIASADQWVESDVRPVIYAIGGVLSSSALTFFLIEVFRIEREARS